MNKGSILIGVLILLAGCRPTGRKPIIEVERPAVDGSLLYANEFGALRAIKTTYENNRLGSVAVTPFADVGFGDTISFASAFSDLGGVVRQTPGSFDWSFFDDKNPPYAAAVLVKRNSGIGADDHKSKMLYQWVGISQTQRSQILTMNSTINGGVRRRMEEFNYWVRARNVKFIDRTSYLVAFTDYFHIDLGKPSPDGIGVDGFVHYIMKFDFAAPDPSMGEVIASFRDQQFATTQLYVSARKNFYTFFSPRWETTGLSPWVMRARDGSYAYDPLVKGNQGYNRAPGHEAFALDMHPTKDSVIAVSDNRFGTMLLEIPNNTRDRFNIVSPILDNKTINPVMPVFELFYEGAWQIRFNHDGTRLAIVTHAPGAPVKVAIWHVGQNRLVQYNVPSVAGAGMTRIGKPAWDPASPNKRFLFFFASDHRSRQGYMFSIDTDAPAGNANVVAWDAVRFSDDLQLEAEILRSPSEIVARREKL